MPPVKDRDRKQIDQPQIYRQNRHEPQHRDNTALSNLSRHLRNAQRPPEFVSRARPYDDLPHRLQGAGRQVPGLCPGLPDRGCGIALDILHPASRDAQQTDLIVVAETVGKLRPVWRHMQGLLLAVAPHDNRHRHIRIESYRLLHVLETMNGPTIDLDNDVARVDPPLLSGAPRLNLPNFGRRERLAVSHEQNCQGYDGKDEIRRRPCGDDGSALAQSLVVERDASLDLAEARKSRGGQTRGGVAVAEHLYIAAEWNRAKFPARSRAIPPAKQLRSETDRKYFDPHPIPARDYIMAELVDKHEHREDHHEAQDGIEQIVELG